MTDCAALVNALYRRLGTWQAVADACNDGGPDPYSRTYFWRIARGTLSPSAEMAGAIIRVTSEVTHVTTSLRRDRRKTVHVHPDCFVAGNRERKRLGLTWPEMVAKLWEAYEEVRDDDT